MRQVLGLFPGLQHSSNPLAHFRDIAHGWEGNTLVADIHHAVLEWPVFITDVERKFGADSECKSMKAFLQFNQRGYVDEYCEQFEELQYEVVMHHPTYDDHFFVSHFLRGLKAEVHGAVESQVPTSVDQAICVALIQHEIQQYIQTLWCEGSRCSET